MSRLRLVKVIVQPIFVLDDGDTLTEMPADPITVAPSGLDTFPAELLRQIEAYNAGTVEAQRA